MENIFCLGNAYKKVIAWKKYLIIRKCFYLVKKYYFARYYTINKIRYFMYFITQIKAGMLPDPQACS